MRFPGVVVPEPATAPGAEDALPAELDARLAAINTRANAAVSAFSRNIASGLTLAQAASGASAESDIWTNAQVRLADLTTFHSRAHIALSDLDALAAKAELSNSTAAERAEIEELRAALAAKLETQASELKRISAQLAR